MMRHEHPEGFARRPRKGLTDKGDLLLVDPSVLESQRARGVDAKYCEAGKLDEWTQIFVDESAVPRERGEEPAEHIVERHVVIAGNAKHLVTGILKPFEEAARLLELLCPGALREVAADDDEIGFQLIDASPDSLHQALIMRAEVQVRKMDEASHA